MDKWLKRKNDEKDESEKEPSISAAGADRTPGSADFIQRNSPRNQLSIIIADVKSELSPNSNETVIQEDRYENKMRNPKAKIAKISKMSPSVSTSKNRIYRFQNEWLDDPELKGWLIKSKSNQIVGKQEMAHCKLCATNIFPHKSDLLRHRKSEKHLHNLQQVKNTQSIETLLLPPCSDGVKHAEIKLCGLLATNNLPFSLMDTLSSLCFNIFPDSKIAKNLHVKRTKATKIICESTGKHFKEQLFCELRKEGMFFSLIMDETTDVGTVKQCAFSIIYFSAITNEVTTSFFDMVETSKSDAAGLYESLKKCLEFKKIPLKNVVGFSSDTTNVMVGKYNSVFSHLKKDLPEIICVKCSCHMVHLAASKACMQLPRSVEDMLRNIGSHFSRSYVRQEKLKEFQEFFKTDLHKILLPIITRWLSVQQCTNRVLEQYEPLKAYFRETHFEDPTKTNEEILKCLDNIFNKIYLEFMSYALEILNDFNTLFQSEVPLLHRLKPEVTRILKILYSNFAKKQYFSNIDALNFDHKNPGYFLPLEQIYVGISAQESIRNLMSDACCDKTDIELFFKTCPKFYIELISELKSRFVFDDPLYDLISIVNPDNAQRFETKTLLPVLQRFSYLKNFIVSPQEIG